MTPRENGRRHTAPPTPPTVKPQHEQLAAASEPTEAIVALVTPREFLAHFGMHFVASIIAAVVGFVVSGRFGLPPTVVTVGTAITAFELMEFRRRRRREPRGVVIWDRDRAQRQRWEAKPEDIPLHRERPLHPDPKPVPHERTRDEMRLPPS